MARTARQLTFETDPSVAVGIPVWSPSGDRIVFMRTDGAIQLSGSSIRTPAASENCRTTRPRRRGLETASGSTTKRLGRRCVSTRSPPAAGRLFGVDAARTFPCLRLTVRRSSFSPGSFLNANEIYKANPENGAAVIVAKYARSQVPFWPTGHALSRDGGWIAVPLKDGATTNIWAIPTSGGPFRQLTDFGRRAILIARQASWAPDGKTIYAAVAETNADVVLLDGIITSSNGR